MRTPHPSIRFWSVSLALLAVACAPQRSGSADAEGVGAERVVAELNGEPITLGELDDWIKEQLFRQATRGREPARVYELRRQALDQMIDQRLLEAEARALGLSPDAVIEHELEQDEPISDEEVRARYEQEKARYSGVPFERVESSIRERLRRERRERAVDRFFARLRAEARVKTHLERPRVEVEPKGPARGPADAPVTIVEFSDFQCPFCRRVHPVLEKVLERYGPRVRLVYRHFPLERIHARARAAAVASVCADEQGRFWPYHDLLFEHAPAFSARDLERYAAQAGLDTARFAQCLGSERAAQTVEADLAAGRRAGVNGTPSFFINGIPLSGSQSLEEFSRVIDAELARLGVAGPGGAAHRPAS